MCDEPPHERNWRLYHLLDLFPPITSKQIKWNFRKVTLRHHYYQAYLVLYNKARKYLYDAAGEEAYGFIASGTWGPLVPMLGATGSILFYCILMMIEIAMLILFFAFLGCRVDSVIHWEWINVVAPLMVFAALMWLTTLFAMLVNFISPRTRREGMAIVDRLSPIGNFLAACAYFCIPFVFGHAVRNNPHEKDGDFTLYMCMPIIGDILYYLTSLIWRWPNRLRLQMSVDNNRPSGFISWGIFFCGFLNMFCGITQWVLIGQKLDNKLNRSWYYIFIPFACRAGIRIFEACLRSLMRHTIGVRSEIGVAFDTVGSFFTNGALLVSLYLVAVRIERGMDTVRMARALIPVYIILAYIFLALIVTMIVLLVKGCESSKEERRGNSNWVEPTEKDEDATAALFTNTTSSRDVPIPSVNKDENVEGGWGQFDAYTNTESNAFPDSVEAEDEEYDDFYTDEEEELFPVENETPHGSQQRSRMDNRSSGTYPREGDQTPYESSKASAEPLQREYHDPYDPKTDAAPVVGDSRDQPTDENSYTEETTYIDDDEDETEETSHTGSHSSSSDYSSSGSYTEETTYLDEESSATDTGSDDHTLFDTDSSSSPEFSGSETHGSDDEEETEHSRPHRK